MFHSLQRTLAASVSCSGFGMHSGKAVHLTIHPAHDNYGIKFFRIDLPDCPGVSAHFNNVVDSSLATVIGYDGFIVSTIEHLMACFSALGIDNAKVEMDAYEMPIMDGSAAPFISMIKTVGTTEQASSRCYFVVKEPIELEANGKFIGLYPADRFQLNYAIEYDHPLIGRQACTLNLSDDVFETDIAGARTFGFLDEYEALKQYGFAQGASLDNVVVIDKQQVLNPGGLRYPDEFVRHKMLDCLGDFSLLGMPILGRIVAEKSGHAFHFRFLKTFFSRKDAWETKILTEPVYSTEPKLKELAI
jgi:UDP-3-O-[3-hydroxymyristoyl] N-acetylglucosamine deacetylase